MIKTFASFGYEGSMVDVGVDLRSGIPAVDIVGFADSGVSELRERLRTAFKNQDLEFPDKRVLISLCPADIRKEGASYELPVALAILAAHNKLDIKEDIFCMGELQLSGTTRSSMTGTYAALQTAAANGIKYAIIPDSTEVVVPDGIQIYRVTSLKDAFSKLVSIVSNMAVAGEVTFTRIHPDEETLDSLKESNYKGIEWLKFAMMLAAAGRHNILATGSPGCGKAAALQRLPEITPDLTANEAQSVMRIHSLAGLLHWHDTGIKKRPFRIPHQTASIEGICGGGVNCRPGEISLAHNGTLFLDEAAEFKSSVLQMLRVPIESGSITLSRAGRQTVYPAKFQLAMATNPCPCGNYGSKDKICLCSAKSIDQYWRKFSSPLLDRVDIRVNMYEPGSQAGWTVNEMRNAVGKAVKTQFDRQGKFNNDLSPSEIAQTIVLSEECQSLVDKAKERYGLSPRAVTSILKVARTYSDVFGETDISVNAIQTAIDLRKPINDYTL